MITFDWPAALRQARMTWMLQKAGVGFRSPFNGTYQGLDFNAERWVVSVQLADDTRDAAHEIEALLDTLAGGVNRVRLWHFASGSRQAPGVPRGTMRGTPTLAASVARGAASFNIQTTAGATVQPGDMVGLAGQLLRSRTASTANGSGVLTFTPTGFVRAASAAGTAIVWDHPTALFVAPAMRLGGTHIAGRGYLGTLLDLEEVW